MEHQIQPCAIAAYQAFLAETEKSPSTITKYLRDIHALMSFLKKRKGDKDGANGVYDSDESVCVAKIDLIAWRDSLLQTHRPCTINGMLTATNGLFRYLGWEDCHMRFLKIQRKLFRDKHRQLTREEYYRLLEAADSKRNLQLHLIMETLCATGIRISELCYITVETVRQGYAQIALKGKIRTILLPGKLCRKLKKYIQSKKLRTGSVFVTHRGTPLSRRQIWAQMKNLCRTAQVEPSKVFPHNLRHLFSIAFYQKCRDIVRLADVLGHSSIETTRIYLLSTEEEQIQQLDRLGLIV